MIISSIRAGAQSSLCPAISQEPTSLSLLDDLLAWWRLNEASGPRVDSHGSFDLADNNTVGSFAGKHSNGASFVQANNESLTTPAGDPIIDPTMDWSLAGWFHQTGGGGLHNIFSNVFASTGVYAFYSGTGLIAVRYYGTAGLVTASISQAGIGSALRFVVASFDAASNQVSINVDNGTWSASVVGSTPKPINPMAQFALGDNPNSGGENADLNADEVGVWQRQLGAPDIDWLYNNGDGRNYSEL